MTKRRFCLYFLRRNHNIVGVYLENLILIYFDRCNISIVKLRSLGVLDKQLQKIPTDDRLRWLIYPIRSTITRFIILLPRCCDLAKTRDSVYTQKSRMMNTFETSPMVPTGFNILFFNIIL